MFENKMTFVYARVDNQYVENYGDGTLREKLLRFFGKAVDGLGLTGCYEGNFLVLSEHKSFVLRT